MPVDNTETPPRGRNTVRADSMDAETDLWFSHFLFIKWRCLVISTKELQINEQIRANEVRLIGADGEQVGIVTTGYRSISTDRSVCVAMVDKAYTELGTSVEIRIRKKVFPGIVTKKRFYETNYKK